MNILETYKEWIKTQNRNWYEIKETSEGFEITSKNATAVINFYEFEITTCELKIVDAHDENLFYLHFELKDLNHAENLFEEMIESLYNIRQKRSIEAMLCCSSGLTTSFFAQQLNEAAQVLSLDMNFMAEAYTQLYEIGSSKDVILLAPQIGYMYEEVKSILTDQIVIQIPAAVFGTYDTGAMISLINEEIEKREKPVEEVKEFTVPQEGEYGTFLVVLTHTNRKAGRKNNTLHYRVYNECDILDDGKILKDKWSLTDYFDLLDVLIPKYPDIENVYIASPGIINDGKFTFNYMNIEDVDIVTMFEERYKKKFAMCSYHKALARGYYEDHKDEMKNFVYYYCGLLNHAGGAGVVMDGKLYHGRNDLSGEIHYMLKSLYFSEYYVDLTKTPEGQEEMTAKQIMPFILTTSPEVITIFNPLVRSIDEVKKYLTKFIPDNLLPELRLETTCIEDMYWGTILMGMEDIQGRA